LNFHHLFDLGKGRKSVFVRTTQAGRNERRRIGRLPFGSWALSRPCSPQAGGVLTRNTATLLIINNLQSTDPQQIRHKPATDPQHGPD
jgi:hypothetical protein